LSGFEQLGILVSPHPAVPPGRFERGSVLARAEVPFGRPEVHVYLRVLADTAVRLWPGPKACSGNEGA